MPQRHMTRHALHAVNLAGHLHLGSQTTEATARHALTADMTLITMNPAALTLDRLIACLQRMKAWMKGNCVPSAGLMLVCRTSVKLKLHSRDSWQPALQCVHNIALCTLISWMYLSVRAQAVLAVGDLGVQMYSQRLPSCKSACCGSSVGHAIVMVQGARGLLVLSKPSLAASSHRLLLWECLLL